MGSRRLTKEAALDMHEECMRDPEYAAKWNDLMGTAAGGLADLPEEARRPIEDTRSWYCEPCAVEVYDRVCKHCGKTRRQRT